MLPNMKMLDDRRALLKEETILSRSTHLRMKVMCLAVKLRSGEEGTAKKEEVMRSKRNAEDEIERDSVGGKRACFNFGSSGIRLKAVMWLV